MCETYDHQSARPGGSIFLFSTVAYGKFHHESVHYAANNGYKVENVPALFEIALRITINDYVNDFLTRKTEYREI